MNILETILSLDETKGKNIELYEIYSKDQYIIYYSTVHNYNDFVVWCMNEKIKIPQVVLFMYMIKNKIEMCNLCLTSGCEIDQDFMMLSCMLENSYLIDLALKKGLKPNEKDINSICDNFYQYIIFRDIESYCMLDTKLFLKRIILGNDEEYANTFKLNKSATNKGECLNIIKKSGIIFCDKIYEKCIKNKININLNVDELIKDIESRCNIPMKLQKDIKELIDKIKKAHKTKDFKMSEKSYDYLMKHKYNSVIIKIFDIKFIKIEDHIINKLYDYAFATLDGSILNRTIILDSKLFKKKICIKI